jgi:hypothetical protein
LRQLAPPEGQQSKDVEKGSVRPYLVGNNGQRELGCRIRLLPVVMITVERPLKHLSFVFESRKVRCAAIPRTGCLDSTMSRTQISTVSTSGYDLKPVVMAMCFTGCGKAFTKSPHGCESVSSLHPHIWFHVQWEHKCIESPERHTSTHFRRPLYVNTLEFHRSEGEHAQTRKRAEKHVSLKPSISN